MSDFIKKRRFDIDGTLSGIQHQHIRASRITTGLKTAVVEFLGTLKGSSETYAYRLAGRTLAREFAAGSICSSYAEQEIGQLTQSIWAVCNFNATVWNSIIKTDTTAKCLETALAQEAKKKFNRPFATLDEFRQNQVFFEIVEQLIEARPKLRYHFFHKPFRKFLRWTVGLALLNLSNRQQNFEFVPDFRRTYISRGGSVGSKVVEAKKKSKRKSPQQPEKREKTDWAKPEKSIEKQNEVSKETGKAEFIDTHGDGETKEKEYKFETKGMLEKFEKEETGEGWCYPLAVKYLDEDARKEYEIVIKNGKLYDSKGKLFDTSSASTFFSNGKAIFVMSEDGRIFASTFHAPKKFHHSSFLSGNPVASAGEILVENGIIKEVTRKSGHYKPLELSDEQFKEKLSAEGVEVEDIIFSAGFEE